MEPIRNAISKHLSDLYPEFPVYVEPLGDGLQKPCFLVIQTSGSLDKETDRRYKRTALFDIQYFTAPTSLNKQSDCNLRADQLYGQLEMVEWEGNYYRCSKLRHEVTTDGDLHFYATFTVHLIKEKPTQDKMQTFEQEVHHG